MNGCQETGDKRTGETNNGLQVTTSLHAVNAEKDYVVKMTEKGGQG